MKFLPWISPHLRPKKSELTIFVNTTLKVWDTLIKGGDFSTKIGPMTPLFFNPEFLPTLEPTLETTKYMKWYRNEDVRMVQILEDGKMPNLQAIGVEYKNNWLQYQQLCFFLGLGGLGWMLEINEYRMWMDYRTFIIGIFMYL